MLMSHIPAMLVSEKTGWEDIDRSRFASGWFFKSLVLPMSLLPPLMILLASGGVGARVFPDAGFGNWLIAAVLFFVAEHFSVPIMANSIRQASMAKDGSSRLEDAYTVAAIAPVPLWLSSLAVVFGSAWFVVLVGLVALGASAMLIRHGVDRLLGIDEDVEASEVAMQVTSFGVLTWLVLLAVAGGAVTLL